MGDNNPIRFTDSTGLAAHDVVDTTLGPLRTLRKNVRGIRVRQIAEPFEIAPHNTRGASEYVDRLLRTGRTLEAEHLIPRSVVKVFNPDFERWYDTATTIQLPREIALLKTDNPSGDNALGEAAKNGMEAGGLVSRAKGNALRSVASHWAQTGLGTVGRSDIQKYRTY